MARRWLEGWIYHTSCHGTILCIDESFQAHFCKASCNVILDSLACKRTLDTDFVLQTACTQTALSPHKYIPDCNHTHSLRCIWWVTLTHPASTDGFSLPTPDTSCFHPLSEPTHLLLTHLPLTHLFCSSSIYLPMSLPRVTSWNWKSHSGFCKVKVGKSHVGGRSHWCLRGYQSKFQELLS